MLSLDELKKAGDEGTIDTVVTAFTDMQGRLFGKRIQIEYFLDEVVGNGIEGCDYLLALDMEISKEFQLTKKYGVRLSLRGFNLTNHFNPRDVISVETIRQGLRADTLLLMHADSPAPAPARRRQEGSRAHGRH
jgi:hypothetical protein